MGATIAKHPREWAALIEPLRERIGEEADVLFGIGALGAGGRGTKHGMQGRGRKAEGGGRALAAHA